jgi:hypothetical protein
MTEYLQQEYPTLNKLCDKWTQDAKNNNNLINWDNFFNQFSESLRKDTMAKIEEEEEQQEELI